MAALGMGSASAARGRSAGFTDYVAKKPKGSRGVHRYSLADIGLDAAEERQRFADYTAHYGVREEND